MATYVLPQVLVFQDFNIRPQAEIRPLNAFIAGGHATLYRYSEADEKVQIFLGTYDHVGESIDGDFKTCYDWPEKPATALIDETYTRLFIDEALLRYFTDQSDLMTKVDSNKIRHPSKNFIENPADPDTYPRHADFLDRDVKVGDIVRVIASEDGGTTNHTLSTYVKDIEADQVAAVVNAAVTDDDNPASQAYSESATAAATNDGSVVAPTVGNFWHGLSVGLVGETYTVVVTQASTGGNHTTARLRVTSASGLDDDLNVTPSAAASPTSIGELGLSLTFAAGNFVVGDTYTVTVAQAWEEPVATSGGTYIGTTDKTYIIEVTKGGDYEEIPEITVTTADGTDFSGPHKVYDRFGSGTATTTTSTTSTTTNAPGLCDTVQVSIGTLGVTVCFSGFGLNKGDRYSIDVEAAKDGNFRILVLGHDLHEEIPLNDAPNAVIDLALYIKKDIEVAEEHVSVDGQVTFDQDDSDFCVHAGIEAFDATWTDDGEPVALPVITDEDVSGTNKLYVEYRAWNQDLASDVNGIRDVADLDTAVTGPTHPDNPLKWALFKALSNNNNSEVKYMAVGDPDGGLDDNWSIVLDKIEDRVDVYGLVPLTRDRTVLEAFKAHVSTASTATAGRWRVLWVNLLNEPTVVVANATTEEQTILATTSDDPDESGSQFTIFNGTPGEGFFANARAGDVIRYQYTVDAWDNVTYNEYVIAEVVNDDKVRTATGTVAAQNVAIKAEVWRDLTTTEQAEALAADAGSWADRRVRAVWPDVISSGGQEMQGYHLCAALAALCSGVVPHQGLTHLEISGFDDVSRTTSLFNRTQLDTMAVAGTWIVTQDLQDGQVFTRHAVTTGDYEDINEREEQVVRNVDSISFHFLDIFSPYIGVSNVTPSMLTIIESETLSAIQFLRRSGETQKLGGQLIDAEITELRAHATLRDRIVLGLSLTIPYALNNLEIHLVI